jgi:VHL beta domain
MRHTSLVLLALFSASAMISGCLGDARPLDEYRLDQEHFDRLSDAGSPPAQDAGADAGLEPYRPGCSSYSSQPVVLNLVNSYTRAEVAYSWMDVECNEVPYGRLEPGKALFQLSYVGHLWRVRDVETGELVKEFRVAASNTVFTVKLP